MTGWTVIVPAKPWHLAKTRLQLRNRAELARAFTLDVLEVVTATPGVERVVVVSAERELIGLARSHGADVVADRPLLARNGLDLAVDLGRRWAARSAPRDPVAVVPGDLPSLTPTSLEHAMHLLAAHERAFIPDLGGGGTTLTAATSPHALTTRYGPGSETRHARAGLAVVDDVAATVRRDVDVLSHLAQAHGLGLRPHTRSETAMSMSVSRP